MGPSGRTEATASMTDRHPSPDTASTTIPVTPDLRDRLRVEVAKDGTTYDEYLRRELPLEDDL